MNNKEARLIEIKASSKSLRKCTSELTHVFEKYFTKEEIQEINALPPRGAYELSIQTLSHKVLNTRRVIRKKKIPLIETYEEMSPVIRRKVFDEFIEQKLKDVPRKTKETSISRVEFFKQIMAFCVTRYGMRKMVVKAGKTGFVADFTTIARGAAKRYPGRFSLRPNDILFSST